MTEAVLLESRDGGILFLTMNRPAALNALDPSLARALRRSIAAAAEDPSVAVLVLRGSGRAFCAGGDISSMKASERVSRANWPRFAPIWRRRGYSMTCRSRRSPCCGAPLQARGWG